MCRLDMYFEDTHLPSVPFEKNKLAELRLLVARLVTGQSQHVNNVNNIV